MDIKKFASSLFEKGKEYGFDDMEIYYVDSNSFEVKVYKEEIDSYNVNSSRGLSFRGLLNGKMGYSYTEKIENEDIEYLLKSAYENACEVEVEGEEFIFEGSKKYEKPIESKFVEIESSRKINDAINLEKLGYEADEKIDSVQHCILETAKGSRRIINSKGLDLSEESGLCIAYLSSLAKDNEDVKNGSSFEITENYNDISFEKIAKEASNDAISKLNAIIPETGKYKIILRYDAAADMIATFAGIFSADAVHKGLSLLKGKVGEKIASEKVTIFDNPFLNEGVSKCTFDDEGVATYKKTLIENGTLKTYLHNLKTSRKDNVESTGNGFKASYKSPVDISPTNFYIAKGERSLDNIIKDINKGILITELQGLHSGANSVSGDFSLAALGMLIENGKITSPVEQITVAGNYYELLNSIEEVANDFKLSVPSGAGGYGSPSLLIKEMNISGK